MRILHVYKSYYPDTFGGVEKLISTLSHSLLAKGIESDIVTTTARRIDKQPKKLEQYNLLSNQAYYFKKTFDKFSCPVSISLFTHFAKIAKKYDVIHYHFPWPFADILHLSNVLNKPTVLTYHSDIVKQRALNSLYRPLMKQFLSRINHIVTTSQNLLNSSQVLQSVKDKTSVIPIGLDPIVISTEQQTLLSQWKKRLKFPFFLFVGVLRYYKGLEYLIAAVKDTNLQVVIAGKGPEEKRLKEWVNHHQLTNVTFVGEVTEEDKWALLNLCYAVVAPSQLRTEAFCITLLEGLMHAKPLISTELGTGTSFVNTHNLTGLVVPPANVVALRQAMERLLADSVFYSACEKASTIHYQQHFTAEKMANAYLELYQKIYSQQLDFRQGAARNESRSLQIVNEEANKNCNTTENSRAKNIIQEN